MHTEARGACDKPVCHDARRHRAFGEAGELPRYLRSVHVKVPVEARGELPILMSDYGVKPPTAMFGLVRVAALARH